MDLMELLLTRRSIRRYTDEPIPEEKLEKILEAGLLAPSGRNRLPWEFVVVRDKQTLAALSHCRQGGAKMLEHAGAAVLVFADPEKTDVWTEDCCIAMSYMQLMAHSLDVGSCWIQGRLREAENGEMTEKVCRDLLGVPEKYVLEAILSLGMPDEAPKAHTADELKKEKIHWEKY